MERLRVGFDLVQVSGIANSVRQFGTAFESRLFTDSELEYSRSGAGQFAERLAARFAAKEATIKALQLSNEGVNWRDIEVRKLRGGDCELALHGRVAELASQMRVEQLALSLSHDGDYAGAFVTVIFKAPAGDGLGN
jgi:holo-[acyl-carrier protein] synthase